MKLVINDTYGGFSISAEALEEYAKLKGIEKLYWFDLPITKDYEVEQMPRETRPERRSFPLSIAYTVPNPDDKTEAFSTRNIPRDDPDLIAVVEKLDRKADGDYARLKVIEIPDDIEWVIEEYDGLEWVAEKHREWH
jgi:hypothetical protein